MFIADQLMKAADNEIGIPRFGRAAQAARDRKASMLNAIAKAMMMDTQNIIAAYFGSNRQLRKDAVAEASDRFRTTCQPACRDRRFPQVDCDGGLTAFYRGSEALEAVRPAPRPASP